MIHIPVSWLENERYMWKMYFPPQRFNHLPRMVPEPKYYAFRMWLDPILWQYNRMPRALEISDLCCAIVVDQPTNDFVLQAPATQATSPEAGDFFLQRSQDEGETPSMRFLKPVIFFSTFPFLFAFQKLRLLVNILFSEVFFFKV